MNAIRSPAEAGMRPRLGHGGFGVAGWLSLAAAPTFAVMALLAGLAEGGSPMSMGMSMAPASPFDGMVPMYVLMAIFHAPAWLRLVERMARGNPWPRG